MKTYKDYLEALEALILLGEEVMGNPDTTDDDYDELDTMDMHLDCCRSILLRNHPEEDRPLKKHS